MMSSVPQFIDVEDKIAGPLTWKQLGWMIAMGATLFIFSTVLNRALTIVVSIPTVLLFLALAFYKPNGFPMSAFLGQAVFFLFRPKMAVWERPIQPMVTVKSEAPKEAVTEGLSDKRPSQEKLRELARLIDSQRNRQQ
jgi:hypothetical protein